MNVYAIGFPLTLSAGLIGLWAVLPLLASSLTACWSAAWMRWPC